MTRIQYGIGWLVAIVFGCGLLQAQAANAQVKANWSYLYNLNQTVTPIYCKVQGQSGSVFGAPIQGENAIQTAGSSATTTASAGTPFDSMGISDILMVRGAGASSNTTQNRIIIAKASGASLTVNTVWTLAAGTSYRWLDTICGTGAEDGWIDVSWPSSMTFHLGAQVNVTGGVNVRAECRDAGLGSLPVQVFPACTSGACDTYQNYVTAGIASSTKLWVQEWASQCRWGMYIGTADDGSDTGADAEQITITLIGGSR